jgi:hypothetical protein
VCWCEALSAVTSGSLDEAAAVTRICVGLLGHGRVLLPGECSRIATALFAIEYARPAIAFGLSE